MVQTFRFEQFVIDLDQRQLRHGGSVVSLNSRYFDVLVLLLSKHGQLITKDHFFETVWGDVVVGDEALTQCIKTLRRVLGDDVRQPRFIETVPKHGYRFIAPVSDFEARSGDAEVPQQRPQAPQGLPLALRTSLSGMAGGAGAGLAGGLIYGYAVALARNTPATGAVLVLIAVVALCMLVGALGALFVSLGLALGSRDCRRWQAVTGATAGGLVVGGLANLIGNDAFALVLGVVPDRLTGAWEGAALGGAIGLALSFGGSPDRQVGRTALACALASVLVVSGGGQMMAGTLDDLAAALLASDLSLGRLRSFVPLARLPPPTELVLAAVEGMIFGAGIATGLCVLNKCSHFTKPSPVHHAGAAARAVGLPHRVSWRIILANDMQTSWLGRHRWRIARWLAAALLLLLPFLALQFSQEMNWGAEDFIWLAAMLVGLGLTFEVALTWSANFFYRAGLVMALGTSFLLIWVSLAVGIIGSETNSLNLLYFAMLGGGALVAAHARFTPKGMVRALLVLAAGQIAVGAVALVVGTGTIQAPAILRLIVATGLFTLLWLAAADLFRRATEDHAGFS
ncbi:winged helix-turn-helix domain-containing protein [Devosia salina]|uniref:Transcriptional regulator n=1 Tax=Devosia salina TaxID=2860336 RepID=A0ABX8WJK9_9HYPH|nr:transcriptional regulator [Devosia salina]QYO78881.1 transcriptional regulator [Devosia salina]